MEPTEEELKEIERLNSITDALWKRGKETNWESMSHTKINVDRTDLYIRSKQISGFMNIHMKQSFNKTISPSNIIKINKNTGLKKIGMLF